ncbi:hypothetical protein [Psychroserpens sp.]|uniref:hypothetical protein n=1 Tax=Psychroserpens sp. TaxID=2020870 RepID=UPI001B24CF63|nr:hypothetical protein [Psychroserpens sp.]MBO6605277.1 hypothetical protein [Psychroserpens sp.]MBO6630256.1 hypothetical protein [Psychroserpens sp.]MBO6653914.1 hypothetical protein [Psychroserpens sp.]MBO6682235.1 hypothetical protein [Psychroserpens sp.]MBO6748651.1 hypothetical protein [Psychroserpens sp.]
MKKKLEADLISIAHRILKLKGKEDVTKMHAEAAALYEKLSVLKFANENFEGDWPTIGSDSSFFGMLDTAFNNKVSDNIEIEDKIYVNLDEKEDDQIYEPVMEKIKDMVAQMPQESQQVDEMVETVVAEPKATEHIEDIAAGFEELPEFEPLSEAKERQRKSLNEQLKNGGLNIGLNDKIAFIKHLFDGKNEDYERVVSQIKTMTSYEDALNLINTMVKPDYNNWTDKEDYEERFMAIIERKFQ